MDVMNFAEVKKQYAKLRENERIKIIDFLKEKGYKASKRGGQGKPRWDGDDYYTNGHSINPYDLSNWKWVKTSKNGLSYIISLQTFDRDQSSGNWHVLFDRISIMCELPNKEVELTKYDLPLDESELEGLVSRLDKLVERDSNIPIRGL